MPVWIVGIISLIAGSIIKALLFVVGFMLFRVLLLLGFSYVIYQGADKYVLSHYDKIKAMIGQLPDFVLQSLALAKVDIFISIVISAIILRFSVKFASKITFFG